MRVEMAGPQVTFSATPRIGLGGNTYSSVVRAGPIVDQLAPPVTTRTKDTEFTAIGQLSLNLNVNVNDLLSFFIGYDFFWAGNVSRPFRNIRYDSLLDPATGQFVPNIVLNDRPSTLWTHGLSAGGVLTFPPGRYPDR